MLRRDDSFEEEVRSPKTFHAELRKAISQAQDLLSLDELEVQIKAQDDIVRDLLMQSVAARRQALEGEIHADFATEEIGAIVQEIIRLKEDLETPEAHQELDDEFDFTDTVGPESERAPLFSELLRDETPIGKGSIAEAFRIVLSEQGAVIVKRGKPGDEEYFLRAQKALKRLEGETGIPQLVEIDTQEEYCPHLVYKDTQGAQNLHVGVEHGKALLGEEFSGLSLPEKEAFVEDLARVISRVHKKDLIHNDLGLDHVLMYPETRAWGQSQEQKKKWMPLLIDFAFARLTEDAEEGQDGLLSLQSLPPQHGKPRYHTPDLVEGYDRDQQWEVEVFAWIACELLTGVIPVRGNIRQLLEQAEVSEELREKLVACTAPRDQRYANMQEFVENPYSRCAAELFPLVLEKIHQEEPEDIASYLQNEYIQKSLAERLSPRGNIILEEKLSAIATLKVLMAALREVDANRDLFIGLFHEYLEDEELEVQTAVFSALEIRMDRYTEQSREADASALYEKAREMLFSSIGRYEKPRSDVQKQYFGAGMLLESDQLVFNQMILEEERMFFWDLVDTSVLNAESAAKVFSVNCQHFSYTDFFERHSRIFRMLRDNPNAMMPSLLARMGQCHDLINQETQPVLEEYSEALALSRMLQEILSGYVTAHYSRRTEQHLEHHFQSLQASLDTHGWSQDIANRIRPLCQSPKIRDAFALINHEDDEKEHSRQHRMKEFFEPEVGGIYGLESRYDVIPDQEQINWVLELLETDTDHVRLKGKHLESTRKLRSVGQQGPALNRFMAIAPTQFSPGQVRRMQNLVFPYSEREAQKMDTFGAATPAALTLEEPVFLKLVEIERTGEDGLQDTASEALLESLQELQHRIQSFWFVSRESQLALQGLLVSAAQSYSESESKDHQEVLRAIEACQSALSMKQFLWYFMYLFAWVHQQSAPAIGL